MSTESPPDDKHEKLNPILIRRPITTIDESELSRNFGAVVSSEKSGDSDKVNDDTSFKWRSFFLYFASTTTAHGFLRIANTRSSKGRVLWITFMVVAMGGLMYHFVELLLTHLSFEVQTEMLNEAVPFEMPSLVICPENNYVKRLITGPPPLPGLFNLSLIQLFGLSNSFWLATNVSGTTVRVLSRRSLSPYVIQNNAYQDIADWVLFCKYDKGQMCNMTNILTRDMSVCVQVQLPKSDNSVPVIERNFWFSFSSGNMINPIADIFETEEMYVDREPIITFNDLSEYPNIDLNRVQGYRLQMTTVQLVIRIQEEFPIRNSCLTTESSLRVLGYHDQIESYRYTNDLCTMLTKQRIVKKRCGCFSETLPVPAEPDDHTGTPVFQTVPFCHKLPLDLIAYLKDQQNSWNTSSLMGRADSSRLTENARCHERVLNSINESELDCLRPCLSTMYTWANINYNAWPTGVFQLYDGSEFSNYILDNIAKVASTHNLINTTLNWIKAGRNDIASFKVMPQKSTGLRILEREAYPISNFLSSIGSILGLWVGISIISIVEIIELFVTVIITSISSKRNRKKMIDT